MSELVNNNLSLTEKIKLIQKEDISNEEKMKKIQELYKKQSEEIVNKNKKIIECKHYERKCSLYSPCCNNIVKCRICHDDHELCDKKFDRFNVTKIICDECSTDQEPSNNCVKCGIQFDKNFCNVCNLWTSKNIVHCNDCGICRVLESEDDELYHCKDCDMCWSIKMKDTHPCPKKKSSREDKCPICMIILHDSVGSTMVMNCGHLIHSECYQKYTQSNFNCPICKKSLGDLSSYWEYLRGVKETILIPDEYKDTKIKISCFDCEKESNTEFYPDNLLECKECGGFNTQKI